MGILHGRRKGRSTSQAKESRRIYGTTVAATVRHAGHRMSQRTPHRPSRIDRRKRVGMVSLQTMFRRWFPRRRTRRSNRQDERRYLKNGGIGTPGTSGRGSLGPVRSTDDCNALLKRLGRCVAVAEKWEQQIRRQHPEMMGNGDWVAMRSDYLDTLDAYQTMASFVIDEVKHNGRP